MLISYAWLKTLVDAPEDLKALCDRFDLTGTGVEALEKLGAQYDGILVGQILTKERHPESDHLWVTSVDIAQGEPLQVVCGAQNFNAGDKIPIATVGAVMPDGTEIKKGKLRGIVSCGMNCSARELGLSNDHSGLMILPADAPVGMPIAEYLGLADTVIDVEITPNRPDCLSMLGMAREVGAMYDLDVKPERFELTEVHDAKASDFVNVVIDDAKRCPRYSARIIRNVKVGPSPEWMVKRLQAMGARSINNVVDATNYILFSLGQPLHAFDYDKLPKYEDGKARIVVRAAKENEPFTTLDGVDRVLIPDMTVISDGDKPVALAGVMGGLDSEVSESTCTVLLECATFNTAHTSRTSRNLCLSSESSMRYERGVDANGIEDRSAQAAALIALLSGGEVVEGIVDVYPEPVQAKVLPLRVQRLKDFVGADIPVEFMRKRLERLGCIVEGDEEVLQVSAPTFRPDLEREIDLYEEVLRLWGMDQVPMSIPCCPGLVGGRNEEQRKAQRIGAALRACGLNETITYSFVDPSDLEKLRMPEEGRGEAVELINPMSNEQSVMRRSVLPGLLHSVSYNQNHGVKNVQLYEIGRVFAAAEGRKQPKERQLLAGVMVGSFKDVSWNAPEVELGFFDAKGVVENLCRELCIKKLQFKALDAQQAPWLQPGRAAQVLAGGKVLGWLGEIHPLALEAYEANGPVAAFELEMKALIAASTPMRDYVDVPRFPGISVDLAIVVPEEVSADRLEQAIVSAGGNLLESARLFDVYRDAQRVGEGKKSMAFSLMYRSAEKTLSSQDVEKVHEKLIRKVCGATGGEVRG